jgi:transcriptional regulator with XRE-family HTH domain
MRKNSTFETALQTFGRRIAFLRKARGWSQERLALESGLARSYLGGVERGARNLSLLSIFRLSATLDIPVADLFSDNDNLTILPFQTGVESKCGAANTKEAIKKSRKLTLKALPS